MWDYCPFCPKSSFSQHFCPFWDHFGQRKSRGFAARFPANQGGGPGRAARRRAPCRERLRGEVAGGGAAGDGAQEEVGSKGRGWVDSGGFW